MDYMRPSVPVARAIRMSFPSREGVARSCSQRRQANRTGSPSSLASDHDLRKTYRFSKDWRIHEAATYFSMYSDNFCWPVRTLREPIGEGRWRKRTPAMAAGLSDHGWSLSEWISLPVVLRR